MKKKLALITAVFYACLSGIAVLGVVGFMRAAETFLMRNSPDPHAQAASGMDMSTSLISLASGILAGAAIVFCLRTRKAFRITPERSSESYFAGR